MADDETALVLLTNYYPYFRGEEYLESEISHLSRRFDRVVVVPTMHTPTMSQTRTVPANVTVLPLELDLDARGRLGMVARGLRRPRRWRGAPLRVGRLARHPLRTAYDAYFESRALAVHDRARPLLEALDLPAGRTVLYSYWLYVTARVAIELSRTVPALQDAPVVSRAHGYDVTVEAAPLRYLPERRFLLAELDRLHPVSQVTVDRLRRAYPQHQDKVSVRRLGTRRFVDAPVASQTPFRVVSCSTVRPLKRLDLLVEALAILHRRGHAPHWTHFGTGRPQKIDDLDRRASTVLPEGSYTLAGAVPNTELLTAYVDMAPSVFVNLSTSEGVPVSVMEVMSAGIPVIATDAGGTAEILAREPFDGLLPVEVTAGQVADRIERLVTQPDDTYQQIALATQSRWAEVSDAQRLYGEFSRELLDLALPRERPR